MSDDTQSDPAPLAERAEDELVESFPVAPPPFHDRPSAPSRRRATRQQQVVRRPPKYEQLPPEAGPESEGTIERVIMLAPELVEPYVVRGFGALAAGRFTDAIADLLRATAAGTRDPFAFLELARIASPRFESSESAQPPVGIAVEQLLARTEELGSDVDDVVALVRLERACIDPERDPELVPALADAGLRSRREPVCRIVEASVFAAYRAARIVNDEVTADALVKAGLSVAPDDVALRFLEVLHEHHQRGEDETIRWQAMAGVLLRTEPSKDPASERVPPDSAAQFASWSAHVIDRLLRPLHGVRSIIRSPDTSS